MTFWLLALLYAPTRLIQEANPDWRLVSWALALEVIGITLCVWSLERGAWSGESGTGSLERGAGRFPVSVFAFPLLFLLVAVPWPTVLEGPLVQLLTRVDVSAACDLAGSLGIPAIPHGNVIEVATGVVGIDEACSGIRSFQATLMISLFLGEFYRISVLRRLTLCLTGFALAILLNLARQTVLIWVAAHQGIPAIAKWHDPTGVVILLGCFFALWGIGVWLAGKKPEVRGQRSEVRGQKAEAGSQESEARSQKPEDREQKLEGRPSDISAFRFSLSAFVFLAAWLLLVEGGVEGWYRWHEARLPAAVTWQVKWPANNSTFKEQGIAPDSQRILRFDDGRNAAWQADDLGWQVVFLLWKPGRSAVRLAQNHTPEVCLAAAGHRLTGGDVQHHLTVNGLKLPFRFYELTDTPQPVFVAYCLWDDRAGTRNFTTSFLTFTSRLAAVRAGQRNSGQRSLEIAITGVRDFASAQAAVQKLLEKIIVPSQ